jgi:hypothetical protein
MKNKTTLKKSPADYPQMIFRIDQTDKDRISELVEKVTRLHNEAAPPERKKIRKNDVIVDALFYGLLHFEKRLTR